MLLMYNLKNTIYINFDHIVTQGKIEIKNEKREVILKHHFNNSNFEKLDMKDKKGKFKVNVSYEAITYTRIIVL